MTVLNLSTFQAADALATAFYMSSETDILAKVTQRYNVLAIGLNASTVMLVSAVAAAVLSSLSAALVLGGVGLALRSVTLHSIENFNRIDSWDERNAVERVLGKMREIKWNPIAVHLLGYDLWLNLLSSISPLSEQRYGDVEERVLAGRRWGDCPSVERFGGGEVAAAASGGRRSGGAAARAFNGSDD